jgi:hypothetical protein
MRRADRIALGLFIALALAATVLAVRVARRLESGGALRLERARVKPTALSAATLDRDHRGAQEALAAV